MNGVFNDYPKNDPYREVIPSSEEFPLSRVFNPRLASINIGISYFFYIDL
jgi:hypothetical protein